jgi:hypothetical protein
MNAARPPAIHLMRKFGLEPDPWQAEVLEGGHPRLLLNCCRQSGKSTVVALLGLCEALYIPFTKVLLVSRSQRQSRELFRKVTDFYARLDWPMKRRQTVDSLELTNQSRIVSLPCRDETIRGYSDVTLLVIDEAARVPEFVYHAVRPMLAVSGGRLICLSTPFGQEGFFHDCWANHAVDWHRIEIPAERVSRIPAAFLAEERRAHGGSWFRQEYCCSFQAPEGVVYPDFATHCEVDSLPANLVGAASRAAPGDEVRLGSPDLREGGAPGLRRVGGIDFGFRNPFAAIWGILDRDGVLWLTGEHYEKQKPLSYHAARLPRDVTWYADPSGANERAELRCAGFVVHAGNNDLRSGIAAVSARIEDGTLRVVKGACPNLLAEAVRYRYGEGPAGQGGEAPMDEHNHALAALRYLITRLDERRQARQCSAAAPPPAPTPKPAQIVRFRTFKDMWRDPELWTTF